MTLHPVGAAEQEEARRLVREALDPHSSDKLVALVSRLLAEARAANQAALRDELTGLGNRRALHEALRQGLAAARRYGAALSLVLVDLDGFKALNDRHGHAAGDAALQAVARAIREEIRAEVDLAARVGGDEFAVVLPQTDAAGAGVVGARVTGRIAALARAGGPPVGASFGSATLDLEDDAATLLARADAALYRAKEARPERPRRAGDAPPPTPTREQAISRKGDDAVDIAG